MEKREIEKILDNFFDLSDEEQSKGIELPFIGVEPLGEELEKGYGFQIPERTGDETNGWQVDFWYKFNHPYKGQYQLSGSLAYGRFKFSKI
ncbi:MAG TPA: hypothetical protein VF680_17075 [Allosphingosinicella sp.]|jgi:hypothetical protein